MPDLGQLIYNVAARPVSVWEPAFLFLNVKTSASPLLGQGETKTKGYTSMKNTAKHKPLLKKKPPPQKKDSLAAQTARERTSRPELGSSKTQAQPYPMMGAKASDVKASYLPVFEEDMLYGLGWFALGKRLVAISLIKLTEGAIVEKTNHLLEIMGGPLLLQLGHLLHVAILALAGQLPP
jgi:hypothetical protein